MMPVVDAPTDDAFLGGQLQILQPVRGYRAGVDAVLLAAAVPVAGAVRVLDAGAGVGVVGLAIARRCPAALVMLVEREPAYAGLAARNIERNGLAARVSLLVADVAGRAGAVPPGEFGHVVANPPYQVSGQGRRPSDDLRARAHEMAAGELEIWARFLARTASPGGTVTIIHRADALGELLAVLAGRFGALVVKPIYPRDGEAAVRVIVHGVKGSRAALVVAPPLVLHAPGGGFTARVAAILRDGAPLDLRA